VRGIRNSAGTRPAAAPPVLLCATTLATAADDVVSERTTFGRSTGDITLDGRLTEAAWRAATPQTHFFEIYPANLGRPAVETTAAFLYDDSTLVPWMSEAIVSGYGGEILDTVTGAVGRGFNRPGNDPVAVLATRDQVHCGISDFSGRWPGWRG